MRRNNWKLGVVIASGVMCVQAFGGARELELIPEPEAEVPAVEVIPDPAQPLNRAFAIVNDRFMEWIVYPASYPYRFVVRKPVREALKKAEHNLRYPGRLLNNLLQAKWRGAGVETARFLVNSTAGLGGLFDVASAKGIGRSNEDFGQTFGVWGWRPKVFFMFPVEGPSNERDAVGAIGDTAMNPASYFFPLSPVLAFNRLADGIDAYRAFAIGNLDDYAMLRDLWVLQRTAAVREPVLVPLEPREDGPAIQTLGAPLFSPRDEDFLRSGKEGRVRVGTTGRDLPYTYWPRSGPAPLVWLVPGVGSHRYSGGTLAMAELAFNAGNSVVAISSTFNHEFIARGLRAPVPGFPAADVRDLYEVMDTVFRDLIFRRELEVTESKLAGVSMGGFQTLYLAAHPEIESGLLRFDRYVAVHPPVNLLEAVAELDAYYNAPLAWMEPTGGGKAGMSRAELAAALEAVLVRTAAAVDAGPIEEAVVAISDIEARYLVGTAFRLILREIIYASQQRQDLGVLESALRPWDRRGVFAEISEYSFAEYLNRFLLPYYAERWEQGDVVEAMRASSDLRETGGKLAGNERVFVVTSENDFVLGNGGLEWIRRVVPPERLVLFPVGGHLGGLYMAAVREAVARVIGRGIEGSEAGRTRAMRPAVERRGGSDLIRGRSGTRQ